MRGRSIIPSAIVALACVLALSRTASAHCDTMDGPVARAGLQALETGNLNHALVWIKPAAESELRMAFAQARKVRALGTEARALADRYFLETLVRLHRAGEGEPFTGILPSGTDVGPAVPAADAAIASGSSRAVEAMIADAAKGGLEQRLRRVLATRRYAVHDLRAGREHVAAYVDFVHYVERLHAATTAGAHAGGHAH